MKNRLKKVVSILLTVAIFCTYLVFPAAAADAVTLEFENGAWSGDYYIVDVIAKAGNDDFILNSGELYVSFDSTVLNFVMALNKVPAVVETSPIPGVPDTSYAISLATSDSATANAAGEISMIWTDMNAKNHTVSNGEAIVTLYFTAVTDAEKCSTAISFASASGKENIFNYQKEK